MLWFLTSPPLLCPLPCKLPSSSESHWPQPLPSSLQAPPGLCLPPRQLWPTAVRPSCRAVSARRPPPTTAASWFLDFLSKELILHVTSVTHFHGYFLGQFPQLRERQVSLSAVRFLASSLRSATARRQMILLLTYHQKADRAAAQATSQGLCRAHFIAPHRYCVISHHKKGECGTVRYLETDHIHVTVITIYCCDSSILSLLLFISYCA